MFTHFCGVYVPCIYLHGQVRVAVAIQGFVFVFTDLTSLVAEC